ncbi:MAG TPA: T9SS type A sorting domain-containing protein, partial [Chitinophagaceae bacterium]|nr:T9SS type A sorting domain-containing protein [Chitinophagaceae bacterium]
GLTDLASNFFPYSIIIPVKLGSFEVNKSGSNAVLNWITHMESNSSHFEVERSTDGVNFISAGTVKAAGSSNDIRTYRFVDPVAGFSSIIYYRLRTVDMDATSSISKIVVLKLEKNKQDIKVRIYPNPFTNDLKLQIFSGKETAATVRISNALGQPVVDRKINLQSGENTIALSAELSSLDKGIYSIQIITQDHRFTEKIIKQ